MGPGFGKSGTQLKRSLQKNGLEGAVIIGMFEVGMAEIVNLLVYLARISGVNILGCGF